MINMKNKYKRIRKIPTNNTHTFLELEELSKKNIKKKHIQILEKFHNKRGKYLTRKEIVGPPKHINVGATSEILPDDLVDYPHRLHNLVRGVYTSDNSGYALSIQMNPRSRFGFEIDGSSPTLLIHYDFGDNPNLKRDMVTMQKCLDADIPFGLIIKNGPEQNKILGLGKIINRKGTLFDIGSYGISDEESSHLKNETMEEFEFVTKDRSIDGIEKIDWKQYIAKIDLTKERFKKPTRTSETIEKNPFTLREIKHNSEMEEWAIPVFQRFFNWTRDDIKDLWISIFHGYYVGAFLLWETRGEPDIGTEPIRGVDNDKNIAKSYVILDGQQRITSIYYATAGPNFKLRRDTADRRYFYIDFQEFFNSEDSDDIIKSFTSTITDKTSHEKLLFPIYELEYYSEWVRKLRRYLLEQNSKNEEITKIIELTDIISSKLEYLYDQFRIPSVILRKTSTSTEEVSEIFEKLNTKGMALSTFDLVVARLFKYNVQMKELWRKTLEKHPLILKYYKHKPEVQKLNLYIFEAISLVFSKYKSCKRKDILNYFEKNSETPKSFTEKWEEMSEYTEKALTLLEDSRNGFGVANKNELPFESMIPVLSALLHEIETTFHNDQPKCFKKLKNWYWASVFSIKYSQGVEGKKSADYKEIISWFKDDKSIPNDIERFRYGYINQVNLRYVNKKSSAIHRGLLCILSLSGATDLSKSIVLDSTRIQQDHIFPKSIYKNVNYVNSILNKTWLTRGTNIQKSSKRPNEYMLDSLKNMYDNSEAEFLKILKSHLIDEDAFECIKDNNFEKFIVKREELMLGAIRDAIGATDIKRNDMLITPGRPYAAKKIARDQIGKCKKYIKWFDKYFTFSGLDLLFDGIIREEIGEIKILLSTDNATENLRKKFKDFKIDIGVDIDVQMRVLIDKKTIRNIHDRWIISKNICFNVPSTDTIMRGQFSSFDVTSQIPPFDKWWHSALDMIVDWNKIMATRQNSFQKKHTKPKTL